MRALKSRARPGMRPRHLPMTATSRRCPTCLRPSARHHNANTPTKMARATGWQAEIPLERTLGELLDYRRERTRPAM
jgi:nucleoside-diphosphate-sugar epimerase